MKLLQVGEGVIKTLVEAAVRNPCLFSLDLSQTIFPPSTNSSTSLAELHALLSPQFNLRKLKLRQCKLSPTELSAIASCLSQPNSSLIHLDISSSLVSPSSASELSTALQYNKSLSTLRMRDCSLGDAGLLALSSFLSNNTTIDHINLSSNQIGPIGAQSLAKGIERNQSIGNLNLSHNPLLPLGVLAIIDAISKNDNLRELDLGFCYFGSSSWTLLSQSINMWPKLWKLDVSGNMQYRSITSPQSPARTIHDESPSSSQSSLDKIITSNINLDNDRIIVDGEKSSQVDRTVEKHLLAENKHLDKNPSSIATLSVPSLATSQLAQEKPIISGTSPTSNDILRTSSPLRTTVAAKKAAKSDQAEYVKSLEELCSALHVNSCLSVIDLSHNPFGDMGCSVLGSLLEANQTIVELRIKRCGLSSKGLLTISNGVCENTASSLSFVDITGNEADGLGPLGELILRNRREKQLAWRPVRTHPIVQQRPHAEFTCLCPVPEAEEIWVACTDGHVHFWPVKDLDNLDDVMGYVDVHSKPVPVTRRRINAMMACRSTIWVLTDESTVVVISQSAPHRISYLTMTAEAAMSERLSMCIVDAQNQIAVLGGGSGDISLWKTAAGEEALVTRKMLGSGFPIVAVSSTPSLIFAGLVMPGRHSSLVVVLDHALEELYRQEVSTEPLISMSCFGNLILTSFDDGSIRLWHCDSREMALVTSYSHIPTQSIHPLGSYFISSSMKHQNMTIWNPTTLTPVCLLDTQLPVKSIAISGPYMAILTEDDNVGLWINH